MKRLFDILCSAAGLILLSPLYLIIYIGLRMSSRHAALFRQERIGRDGRPFQILKFRTMVVNDEACGLPMLAEEDDERLTRLGKYLRKTHLDELPQLWNVLRGDMSFVGYRPERQFFIKQIMELRPDYAELYQMRPGITSRAAVYNGYTNTMEKMLRRLDMDLEYLHHHSMLDDLRIIGLTVASIAFPKVLPATQ